MWRNLHWKIFASKTHKTEYLHRNLCIVQASKQITRVGTQKIQAQTTEWALLASNTSDLILLFLKLLKKLSPFQKVWCVCPLNVTFPCTRKLLWRLSASAKRNVVFRKHKGMNWVLIAISSSPPIFCQQNKHVSMFENHWASFSSTSFCLIVDRHEEFGTSSPFQQYYILMQKTFRSRDTTLEGFHLCILRHKNKINICFEPATTSMQHDNNMT